MAAESRFDSHEVSSTGGRTLEIFAGTPRLNDWYYSKLRPRVRGRVLEIGSGVGNISRLLLRDAESAVLTDVEDGYLESLGRELGHDPRVDVARFDLEEAALPELLRDRTFDTIVGINVIEHLRDDLGAVRRLTELLAPGGYLLAYVPAMPFAYGSLDEALGHHRRYTAGSFRRLLVDAGLRVEALRYMNLLGLPGWTLNGRLLRRRVIPRSQVDLFERLVGFVRLEDYLRLPAGLGVWAHARRPR